MGQNGSDGDFIEYVTYDQYGRLFQEIDATHHGVQYQYNAHGYMEKMLEATNTSLPYYTVNQTDSWGAITQENMHGAYYTVNRGYEAQTGLPTSIAAKTSLQLDVLNLQLGFDALGNLISRNRTLYDHSTGSVVDTITEDFHYDELNRLTTVEESAQTIQSLSYDSIGNLLTKTGVGTYTYGQNGAGPHAVTSAGSDTYTYDAVGNMLSGAGRTLTYNTFRLPVQITKGGHTTSFAYGPDRARYKRLDNDGISLKKTIYVGNVEFITTGTALTTKRYIGGVAVVTDTSTSHNVHYLFRDHLGSINLVADESYSQGQVEEMSFDAFGKRRHAVSLSDLTTSETSALNAFTTRGFTGHEMLDDVGLIHMNGRVYDPVLGRFLSADPFVQSVTDTQSLNRYSYVLNNPLSFTDPNGFEICDENCPQWPSGSYPNGQFDYDYGYGDIFWEGQWDGVSWLDAQGNFQTTNNLIKQGQLEFTINSDRSVRFRQPGPQNDSGNFAPTPGSATANTSRENLFYNAGVAMGGAIQYWGNLTMSNVEYIVSNPGDVAFSALSFAADIPGYFLDVLILNGLGWGTGADARMNYRVNAALGGLNSGFQNLKLAAESGDYSETGSAAMAMLMSVVPRWKAPRVKAFDIAGIPYREHFAIRISGRSGRGITPQNALEAYNTGRLYYDPETKYYLRHNSRTGVTVVVDHPSDGVAISVFEGSPSPSWVPMRWRR